MAALAVLAGFAACSGGAQAATPGSPDATFGAGGAVSLSAGIQVFGVAAEPNGDVLAAGQSGGKVFLEQFDPSGHPAGSYTGAAGYARAVAVQSNGDVVIAGFSNGAMFAQRLTAALTPDPSFGSGGVATAFAGLSAIADGVAVGSDGSIVAAGSVNPVDTRVGVAKFSATGAVDFSQVVDFGPYSVAHGVAVQPDGKIVIVGSQNPSQLVNAVIARLTSAGALDPSFAGGRGAFTYSYPGSGYTAMNAVTLQSNGDIVAAGAAAEGPTTVTLRITPAGALDPSYGSGGVAVLPAGQNVNIPAYPIGAYGVAIAAGGRIVAAGNYENTGTEIDQGLWAFDTSGAADPAFGSSGTVRSPAGAVEGCAIAVAPDGSLLTVGDSVTSFPDMSPCAVNAASAGFVSRFTGFGAVGAAPGVSTGAASAVTASSAKVSGQVNPNGLPTTYQFQYGKTTAYGSSTTSTGAGAGSAAQAETASLSRLASGTTYHYRVVATNPLGTSVGSDHTFKTSKSRLRVTLKSLGASVRKGPVAKSGLRVRVNCSQGCSIKASLIAGASIARKLHVVTKVTSCRKVKGKRHCTTKREQVAFTVASAKGKLTRSGTRTLTIKGGKLRAALGTSQNVSLTLSLSVTSGSQKTAVKRNLKFHP